MKLILLTGMRGRVGSALSNAFKEIGFVVRSISHNSDYSKYLLPSCSELSAFDEVFVVHSGQPNAPRTGTERINYLSATRDLIEATSINALKFVFVSSLSAHQDNRSSYSRDKQYLEELTIANSGLVIKLGIVSGLKNGYDLKIVKMQKLLSHFQLSFILTSSTIYYTNVESLMNVALDLDRLDTHEDFRVYDDAEFCPLMELTVFKSSLRRFIVAALSFLSKLGSGSADVLLNVMGGMKFPK